MLLQGFERTSCKAVLLYSHLPDLCLLWVDAHIDINTPMIFLSNHVHCQPLAFLIKELFLVKSLRTKCYSVSEIDKLGIGKVMEETLAYLLPKKKRLIYLHFEIDDLAPSLASVPHTPVPGGMTFREGIYVTEELYKTGRITHF
ncbi:arginase-1 [Elgaria multicarinata webbii]|uniref:arginase-1 n=1 Tax=Elgaria multicarinata webbii TaxID=159646 RepID=UPI002FCCCAE9